MNRAKFIPKTYAKSVTYPRLKLHLHWEIDVSSKGYEYSRQRNLSKCRLKMFVPNKIAFAYIQLVSVMSSYFFCCGFCFNIFWFDLIFFPSKFHLIWSHISSNSWNFIFLTNRNCFSLDMLLVHWNVNFHIFYLAATLEIFGNGN